MITATVLVILGILLVMVLSKMAKSPRRPAEIQPLATPPPSLPASTAGDLWTARKGDVVSIPGAAEDFTDLDFTIDRRSAYESKNWRWIDLSGEFRGRRVYLEVHGGPDPEVMGILDARRLTLPDIGLTEDQLADMDARQDPSAVVQFEGRQWNYESSREVGYFENEQPQGEGLYRWLFREQNGPRLLCIEKWEGQPFDVRVAQRLNPQDINLYRAA